MNSFRFCVAYMSQGFTFGLDLYILPTKLLDMMEDPYLEDRQLAAPKEILDLVERFERNLESKYVDGRCLISVSLSVFKVLKWM